jgi:3',5'-cyclic-AMP phosphodiesterase
MPAIFQPTRDRRSFLKTTLLGGALLSLTQSRDARANPIPTQPHRFHLALLSDTHVPGDREHGHRGFNPWVNLQQIVPQVVESQPEGVIICGDAARLDGKRSDYEELRALLAPIADRTPVYIGLGNHDDRGPFFEVFPDPPGTRPSAGGRHITLIEHDVVRILILDSLLYVDRVAGFLGRAQRTWLETSLPKLNDRPLVLMVHHTLGDGDGDLLDADRLFALLSPHPHVKAIFYGHSHVWNISERAALRLINLPATGYNFRDQDPVGWIDASFHPTGVDLTLRALAGNRTDDGRTTRVEWPQV